MYAKSEINRRSSGKVVKYVIIIIFTTETNTLTPKY